MNECKGLGGGTRSHLVPPPKPLQTLNIPAHCIATPEVKLQPEDGPHAGPKHLVVSPMY